MTNRLVSPAFLFYPRDWRSSPKVRTMTFAQRGMYLELLCEQWESGAIPATPAECATLIGGRRAAWTRAWATLKQCFRKRLKNGMLRNSKLAQLQRERAQFLQTQQQKGLQRWHSHSRGIAAAMPRHMPDDSLRSRSGSRSQSTRTRLKNSRVRMRAAEDFEAFWHAYPKKRNKHAALRAWHTLHPDATLLATMVAALAWQTTQPHWVKDGGRYIPYPATWLTNGGWTDEPSTIPQLTGPDFARLTPFQQARRLGLK